MYLTKLRLLFQRWDEREKHLAKFLRDLTGQFRQIRTTDGFATNRSLQVGRHHDARKNVSQMGGSGIDVTNL